eukprot:702854-Hanusia_phi.AAC.1
MDMKYDDGTIQAHRKELPLCIYMRPMRASWAYCEGLYERNAAKKRKQQCPEMLEKEREITEFREARKFLVMQEEVAHESQPRSWELASDVSPSKRPRAPLLPVTVVRPKAERSDDGRGRELDDSREGGGSLSLITEYESDSDSKEDV